MRNLDQHLMHIINPSTQLLNDIHKTGRLCTFENVSHDLNASADAAVNLAMNAKGHDEMTVLGAVVKATGHCQSDFEMNSTVSLPRSMRPSNGPLASHRRQMASPATCSISKRSA